MQWSIDAKWPSGQAAMQPTPVHLGCVQMMNTRQSASQWEARKDTHHYGVSSPQTLKSLNFHLRFPPLSANGWWLANLAFTLHSLANWNRLFKLTFSLFNPCSSQLSFSSSFFSLSPSPFSLSLSCLYYFVTKISSFVVYLVVFYSLFTSK